MEVESHTKHYNTNGIDRQTMHAYCQLIVSEATAGEELAAAARLLAGSEMAGAGFGDTLRGRIIARAKVLSETNDPKAAAKEAAAIGEAMLLLQRAASN